MFNSIISLDMSSGLISVMFCFANFTIAFLVVLSSVGAVIFEFDYFRNLIPEHKK